MKLTIKYFGMLSDITQCNQECINFSKGTVQQFLEQLFNKYPELKEKSFKVSQNQVFVSKETELTSNEIVLLPPFAGG